MILRLRLQRCQLHRAALQFGSNSAWQPGSLRLGSCATSQGQRGASRDLKFESSDSLVYATRRRPVARRNKFQAPRFGPLATVMMGLADSPMM